jgi:cadmium resistance protein CadD (predicted permease)
MLNIVSSERRKIMYWATGILGILLIIAPFVLGFSSNPSALWTGVILGAITLIVSLIKAFAHDVSQWEYWVTGLMGILAIIAPFVLGFTALTTAMWTSIILGVITLVLSAVELFRRPTGRPVP